MVKIIIQKVFIKKDDYVRLTTQKYSVIYVNEKRQCLGCMILQSNIQWIHSPAQLSWNSYYIVTLKEIIQFDIMGSQQPKLHVQNLSPLPPLLGLFSWCSNKPALKKNKKSNISEPLCSGVNWIIVFDQEKSKHVKNKVNKVLPFTMLDIVTYDQKISTQR